ncbi:MAG: ABC transporter ATP-binding protein [Clostridia bacterium]|nr:ABC transporter ATP-binding protein [Clostridia bacterium]
MNKIKFTAKSIAYSWKLVFESSKFMIFLYFALVMLTENFPLLTAFLLQYVLNMLASGTPETEKILAVIALYGAALVINQGLFSAQTLARHTIDKKFRHFYERRLAERLAVLPLEFIDSSQGKDTVTEVRYAESYAIDNVFYLVDFISCIYTFTVAFSTLAVFSLGFSLVFLALTVPSVIFKEYYERKKREFQRKTAPDLRKVNYYRWMLTDAWPAKDVRMYDLTDAIKARYGEEKRIYLRENKKLGKKMLRGSLFIELFRRAGEIAFTAYVVYKAANGNIGIGDVALYIGFANKASDSFFGIIWQAASILIDTAYFMKKLFAFLEMPTEQTHGTRKPDGFESLTFDNVYFKYPHTEKYVLSGVSFTMNKGDKLSIVGINGSGKSTIIKLMLGLYRIESGQILINGYPMSDYDIRDVRKLFSALFQNFVKYPLTLRENIALSALDRFENDGEIEAVLAQSGIYEDLKPKLENGLDSFMTRQFDDKGTALSGGQWQKIALSRAYFKNAPVIIFDEPSAALDAEAEDRIFQNFASISEGKTGIMISHRISSARMSNKVIVLDGGKITEQGSHEELLALGGLYAKLYNLQKEKYTAKEAV